MGEHNLFINLFFHDLFFLLCISVSFLLCVWRKHQKAVLPRIHLEEGLWHFRQVTQFILISMRRLLIQAYISSFYRLTPDFIAERLGHANFSELRELDLPHCSLRTVDLGTKDVFINLRRLVSPRHPSSSPCHCHMLSSSQVLGILFLLWTSEKARAILKTANVPRQ